MLGPMTIPTRSLNDGTTLPALGLGTYGLRRDDGVASIVAALQSGYRLVDTALNYKNEKEVGEAVRTSGIAREEIVVTTKLPGRHHAFDDALRSFDESMANLGLDYLDLYLIHWPNPGIGKYVEAWRAMIQLREQGRVRSIGVSNFTPRHIDRLVEETGVLPAVNQVELHPHFPQDEQRRYHEAHDIVTESWSPLGKQRKITKEGIVARIAEARGVTPTQVVLRWHVELGAVPIPKSGDPDRQRENMDVFDFELSDEEIASISALKSGRLWAGDPDKHQEF